MDISLHFSEVSEEFSAVDAEASPGYRLLDQFPDRVTLDLKIPKTDDEIALRLTMAETIVGFAGGANGDRFAVVCCDGSLPTGQFQAVAAFGVLRNGDWTCLERTSLGRATALDAEIAAIHLGIGAALLDAPEELEHVVLFSDSTEAIRLAFDPSVHTSQWRSLNLAARIRAWLGYDDRRKILLVHVSKKLDFWFHTHAHGIATSVREPLDHGERGTFGAIRNAADDRCSEEWVRLFQTSSYRGSQFLDLKRGKKRLKPSDRKGGPWISAASSSNSLMARASHAITAHAPIGSYRARFRLPGDQECPCGGGEETRLHILTRCPFYWRRKGNPLVTVGSFIGLLKEHLTTFTFEGPGAIPDSDRAPPPGFFSKKRGRHKRPSRDPWANNLEYQRDLALMRGEGGLPAQTVIPQPPASPRRSRASLGGLPFQPRVYGPHGQIGIGFDEAVAALRLI